MVSVDAEAMTADATTAVSGSSFCSFSAAMVLTDADVDADLKSYSQVSESPEVPKGTSRDC